MLFLTSLYYFISWPLFHFLTFLIKNPIKLYLLELLLLLLCIFLAYLTGAIFNPEVHRKPLIFLRNLTKTEGIRNVALASGATALAVFLLSSKTFWDPHFVGLFAVIIFVSFFNSGVLRFLGLFEEDIWESLKEFAWEFMIPGVREVPKLHYPLPSFEVISLPKKESKRQEGEKSTIEVTELDNIIKKKYTWKFRDKRYTIEALIKKDVYQFFKQKERILNPAAFAKEYVSRGIVWEIIHIASQLSGFHFGSGTLQEVEFILSFVQASIKYEYDKRSTGMVEYPRYPVETLVDEEGDCEDVAILGAALLKALGYDVAILLFSKANSGHAAIGVAAEGLKGSFYEFRGVKYYYAEMTSEGWRIGEEPAEYKSPDVIVEVYPVPDPPPRILRVGEQDSDDAQSKAG